MCSSAISPASYVRIRFLSLAGVQGTWTSDMQWAFCFRWPAKSAIAGMLALGNNQEAWVDRLIKVKDEKDSRSFCTADRPVWLRPKKGGAFRIRPNRVSSCAKTRACSTKLKLRLRGSCLACEPCTRRVDACLCPQKLHGGLPTTTSNFLDNPDLPVSLSSAFPTNKCVLRVVQIQESGKMAGQVPAPMQPGTD